MDIKKAITESRNWMKSSSLQSHSEDTASIQAVSAALMKMHFPLIPPSPTTHTPEDFLVKAS